MVHGSQSLSSLEKEKLKPRKVSDFVDTKSLKDKIRNSLERRSSFWIKFRTCYCSLVGYVKRKKVKTLPLISSTASQVLKVREMVSKYLLRLTAYSFGEFKNHVASWYYYAIPLNTAKALCPLPQDCICAKGPLF